MNAKNKQTQDDSGHRQSKCPERTANATLWLLRGSMATVPGGGREGTTDETLCQAKETATGPIVLCDCINSPFLLCILVRLDQGLMFTE